MGLGCSCDRARVHDEPLLVCADEEGEEVGLDETTVMSDRALIARGRTDSAKEQSSDAMSD